MDKSYFWEVSEQDLQKQVSEYSTLGVTKSYRGVATLLLCFSIVLSVILWLTGILPGNSVLIGILLYVPITIFVYRGATWAIIVAMLFWSADKSVQLFTSPKSAVTVLIWWGLYMTYLYKALRVEKARKLVKAETPSPPSPPSIPQPPVDSDPSTTNS